MPALTEPAGLAAIPPEDRDWADLVGSGPALPPDEVRDQVNDALGIGASYRRPRPAGQPDTGELRERLEL